MNTLKRKLTAILLTFAMLFSLMPALPQAAEAATGQSNDGMFSFSYAPGLRTLQIEVKNTEGQVLDTLKVKDFLANSQTNYFTLHNTDYQIVSVESSDNLSVTEQPLYTDRHQYAFGASLTAGSGDGNLTVTVQPYVGPEVSEFIYDGSATRTYRLYDDQIYKMIHKYGDESVSADTKIKSITPEWSDTFGDGITGAGSSFNDINREEDYYNKEFTFSSVYNNLSSVQPYNMASLEIVYDDGAGVEKTVTVPADDLQFTVGEEGSAKHYNIELADDSFHVVYFYNETNGNIGNNYFLYDVKFVEHGKSLGENMPADPTYENSEYVFVNWDQDSWNGSSGKAFLSTTIVNEDMTVFARKASSSSGNTQIHVVNAPNNALLNRVAELYNEETGSSITANDIMLDDRFGIRVYNSDGSKYTDTAYGTNYWGSWNGTENYYYNVSNVVADEVVGVGHNDHINPADFGKITVYFALDTGEEKSVDINVGEYAGDLSVYMAASENTIELYINQPGEVEPAPGGEEPDPGDDLNGTAVTVQVVVDGDPKDDPHRYVNLSRNTENTSRDKYSVSEPDTNGVLTFDFNYNEDEESGHDCVDIDVNFDANKYVLQGVKYNQSSGSGSPGQVQGDNGVYTIDNVVAGEKITDELAHPVDCTIYLYTKYGIAYYLDDQLLDQDDYDGKYVDDQIYIIGKSVETSNDPVDATENYVAAPVAWANPNCATSISLKELPKKDDYTVSGWNLGSATGAQYSEETTVNVADVIGSLTGTVIPFYATSTVDSKNLDGITKTVVTDAKDIAAAVGDKLDSYTFPVDNKVTVKEGSDVTLVYKITVEGTPQTSFIVKDMDAKLLPAGKGDDINNGVTETKKGFEGTIGANGSTSFYVTRTFTDLQVDSEPLKNVAQAYLPGKDDPEKTDDATVDVTVEPNLDITGFKKSVVNEDEASAAAVAETGDYDYPVDGVVTVHDGKANILFKIKITGNAGTEFGLTDNGAKIVKWENADIEVQTAEQAAQGEYRGKLSTNGDDPITAVIYVSKEYDNLDLGKNDETNIATIMNISDPESVPDDGKASADVTIDYIPELPSDEEIIELLSGDAVKVTCTNEDVKHDAKQYKLWAGTFTQDENFTVSEDGTYTFNVKVNPEEYVKAFIGETFINNDQDKGNVDHWIDTEQVQQDQITLIYDAKNGKWKVDENTVPAQFYVLCAGDPTYDIQSFTKTVITENDKDTLPEELQNRTDYVVPAVKEDGTIETVTVPAGDTVTLLYAIKVEGADGTKFTVNDPGADLVYTANDVTEDTATDTFTGTIDKTGSVLFYVTRTFAFDDVKDGKLVNKATITAGDNTSINPDEVTEEEEVPAEQAMKVTPVDMTIYMGGNYGYEAVVDNSGKEMATTSLPEPLFLIESGQDGFEPTKLSFTNATQNKSWTVTKVGETADHTRGIYRLSGAEGQDPVRVQYTDANGTAVTNDTFEPTNELYATYDVEMYYGGNNPDDIVAKYDNDEYAVVTTAGTLTVRGVDNTEAVYVHQDTLPTEELAENVEAAVTAAAGTEFALNNTTVPVEEKGVGLLFDGIIDDATHNRTGALKDAVDEQMGAVDADTTRHYDAKYLDLVDTNNGNAWVKTTNNENVTITWAYPEGTDENTKFTVYHFEGLHRDGENSGFEMTDLDKAKVETKDLSLSKAGISFDVASGDFSPYVLVWETDNSGSDTPGGDTPGGDDPWYPPYNPGDDDKPSGLNTEDHFSYVVGYEDGMVKPQRSITRAEVATIFYRLLEDDVRDDYDTTRNNFSDVTSDSWYNQTVSTLASMGILKGYEDGTFRPNASITRAEFAAIATRFFEETGATYEPGTFTDVTGDEWFAGAIMDAVNLGLIGGYEDGTVRPNNNITRAEACAIVNRTLGRVPDADHLLPADEMTTWPDNPSSAWFYADMQEATNGHEYEWITEDGNKIEEWTDILDKDWNDR